MAVALTVTDRMPTIRMKAVSTGRLTVTVTVVAVSAGPGGVARSGASAAATWARARRGIERELARLAEARPVDLHRPGPRRPIGQVLQRAPVLEELVAIDGQPDQRDQAEHHAGHQDQ